MSETLHLSDAQENAIARKNVLLYFICQSLSASSAPINIALGAVIGQSMLGPDKSLATAPITSYNIGVAIGAVCSNAIMRRIGRKRGFMVGSVIGASGMSLTGAVIIAQHFWLFCAALLINGIAGGFTQQFRFAAADRGTVDFKPKAISWVMAGGIAAAVVGPQISIHASGLVPSTPYAGAFFFATTLFLLSFVALMFLNPSNLTSSPVATENLIARPLVKIITQPRFMVAVFCGTSTYALMSFIMTASPLAMTSHGFSVDQSTLGIQWHVLAMFAPSFFTGILITRFGNERIVATGLCLLMACGVVGLMGLELRHFWGALILLGLGWNFGFIGATSMVTETYQPHEKNRAQGTNDFIVFGTVAFASLMSGITLNHYGWGLLNWIIFPLTVLGLLSLLWLKSKDESNVGETT